MASEDVQTNLRLPADLKERLVASAAENNRSLSAEVASRLEQSFKSTSDALEHKVSLLVSDLKGRVQTLGLREWLLESRIESLQTQSRLLSLESDLHLQNIETDEGLRKVEESGIAFRALEKKILELGREAAELAREREELLGLMSRLKEAVKGKREELEQTLEKGFAQRDSL